MNLETFLCTLLPILSGFVGYQPYYYYTQTGREFSSYELFPFFLLTEKKLLLLSSDMMTCIFTENPEAIHAYQQEFQRALENSSQFFLQSDSPDRILNIFGSIMQTKISTNFALESHPCLALMSYGPGFIQSLFDNRDIDLSDPVYAELFQKFEELSIGYFLYIGGNDSMDTVDKLSKYLNAKGITDITVVGAPKTIDNDLCGTDHCPGFGSAAKYIGTTFAELERDCHVYATKAVTIVEVMGRDAGWLTAASCLARANGAKGPDFIYLCEVPFSIDTFLKDVKAKLEEQDAVIIAVSEGVKNKDGRYISEEVQSSAVDSLVTAISPVPQRFWKMLSEMRSDARYVRSN